MLATARRRDLWRPLRGLGGLPLAASGAVGWAWPRPLGGRGLPPGWQGRSPLLFTCHL